MSAGSDIGSLAWEPGLLLTGWNLSQTLSGVVVVGAGGVSLMDFMGRLARGRLLWYIEALVQPDSQVPFHKGNGSCRGGERWKNSISAVKGSQAGWGS